MRTLILAALVLLLSTRAAARARDRNRPNRMPRVKVGPAPPDASTLDVEIVCLRDLDVASLQARSRNVLRRKPCFG
jgi:hypothetical protein